MEEGKVRTNVNRDSAKPKYDWDGSGDGDDKNRAQMTK